MDADAYIEHTKPAVQHLFAALQVYDALTIPPSLARYADADGVVRMTRDDATDYLHALSGSLTLDFPKATLCGSIAQIAYMAIKLFSQNESVDAECAEFSVSPNSTAVKFCIGRRIHGIPVGLLVYACRVQYNHWEEGTPCNPVPKAVFERLRGHYFDDISFDMAYVVDWPEPRPVSHHILRHELHWMSYEDYLRDMREALESAAQ